MISTWRAHRGVSRRWTNVWRDFSGKRHTAIARERIFIIRRNSIHYGLAARSKRLCPPVLQRGALPSLINCNVL